MSESRIALSVPCLSGHEAAYVAECLATNWISTAGPFVGRFERDFAAYVGSGAHAAAVINGTAALHLSLRLAGVGPGDAVLVPTLTFIAPVNAVTYVGATPVFLDVAPHTLGLAAAAVAQFLAHETTPGPHGPVLRAGGQRVKALIAVHLLGHACELRELLALAAQYGLTVIEDAAEAAGTTYHGQHVGTFGLAGCFSFNGNKALSTGGGGMLVSRDAAFASHACHLANQAKADGARFIHDEVGYNYRLSNIHAAIGVAQLEHFPAMLARKRAIHAHYAAAVAALGDPRVTLFTTAPGCESNCWLALLLVPAPQRDAALALCHAHQVEARPFWELIHRQALYQHHPGAQAPRPVAADFHARGICLPCHAGMTDSEVARVAAVLQAVHALVATAGPTT